MTENEKKALKCFPYPRTLDHAYLSSSFRNRVNFKFYVDKLLASGKLTREIKKERDKDNLTTIYVLYKRSKRDE